MNYRIRKKFGKLHTKQCKALAKHGGRCKKRAKSSGSYCQHHKHLMLEKDKDLPPRLTESQNEGGPTLVVHDITPDEMDMSDSTVSSVPLETNSEDDAPMRDTPNSDAEPSSANPDQDGSQRQDSVTEEVSTTKPTRLTEGNDNTGANSYPLRSLDSPPEVDFAEKEAKRSNNENPGFYSSINQNSGNTMNMNCGNTMQQNCGNTTTNNDSSRIIRVARQYKTVIINKYGGFFKEDDPIIEQLVRKAAAEMMNFIQQYNVPAGKETAMVELALFDMVVVCDNSLSMYKYKEAMQRTLRELVKISSLLLPKGITIQFLNTNGDKKNLYENINTGDKVDNIFKDANFLDIKRVVWSSPEIGDVVNRDIVHPMIIRKARAGELKRPVITIMLTDAKIRSAQGQETLKSTIRSCKNAPDLKEYGDKAALFVLSRVGDSKKGKDFASELERDSSINDILHCSADSLNKWEADCRKMDNKNKYTGKLIELFLTALDRNGTA
ncbi:hypothetical protein ASPFODRAFT_203478 [Aspergillus luchuensis CBS 106.47]|uniref:VWFA domain-containing protein n=1 Tax=Aspergillus luchuensis (strain CBS 106.47) TaxID=1137211 RepID=A0A1M3TW12_ASPLC|nr:hypothetical protein ASPFODRAFT_203478 [Aspergillus luchuensis CBS 106.47]